MALRSKSTLPQRTVFRCNVQDDVSPCRPRRYDIWEAAARRRTIGQSLPIMVNTLVQAVQATRQSLGNR